MKGRALGILLTVSIAALGTSVGCAPNGEIKVKVVEHLVETNEATVAETESEVDRLEQQIDATEEKIVKLEQVITPALEWVKAQETEAEEYEGSWTTRVTQEGLDKLENDQYQVTTLEFTVVEIGTGKNRGQSLSSVIKVTDLTAERKRERDWEELDNELREQRATLEQQRQAKVDDALASVSTLETVIGHFDDWQVRKTKENTYSISGPGLGWTGVLTTGEWLYDGESGLITPADSSSKALEVRL